MDPVAILAQFGWPVGSLIIAVLALFGDVVVSGARFRAMEKEKATWQQLALELGGMTHRALNLVDRQIPPRPGDS